MPRFEITELCNSYLEDLLINKRSIHTIKNYKVTFNQLTNTILEDLQRATITPEEFEKETQQFLKFLSLNYSSTRTLNAKRTHLRGLIIFAFRRGYIPNRFDGNIESLKVDTGKETAVLRSDEIERIEQLLRDDIESAAGYEIFLRARNRFLFMTFIWTGGRIAEVAKLKWEDIDTETGKVTLHGKGNKTRTIPIVDAYILQIFRYKEILNRLAADEIVDTTAAKFVFSSYHKKHEEERPMTTKALYDILTDIFRRAEVNERITPHSLRHTLASYAIKEGVSITVLSKILGHSSVRITTEVYAHVIDEKQMKEEMSRVKYTTY